MDLRRRSLAEWFPDRDQLESFDWPLETIAYWAIWVVSPLCIFWLFIDSKESDSPDEDELIKLNWRRARFVLAWLAALIALWWLNPTSTVGKVAVGVVAAWRLFEIFVTGIGTILGQQQQARARNALTILIYAFQVMLIFAILYHSFAAGGFGLGDHHPRAAADFLYMSGSALVTLGHEEFVPKTDAAKFLEVGTTVMGFFLFSVLLSLVIDTRGGKPSDE